MPKSSEEIRLYQAQWYQEHREQQIAKASERKKRLKDDPIEREKRRKTDRLYANTHREQLREKDRLWQKMNPEKVKDKSRRSYEKHAEKRKQYSKKYRREHQEQMTEHGRVYRKRKYMASRNDLTVAQWLEIKKIYGYRCAYCHQKTQKLTMDHITPLSKGGDHTLANIVPACHSCNSHKRVGPPLIPVQPLLLTIAPARAAKG